jgi:hypothetical protein
MSDVVVTPVAGRRDRKLFLRFPWELYRDDPNWVPPLLMTQEELLGYRRHPFHDNAEVQTFLARRGDRVVGRIAAILNHAHNRHYHEQRGFFGFFESVDDLAVSRALLDAVRDWCAARGIRDLRGPANPSMNHECGLLIEGFDRPPVFMMTYNPPYYARLIEDYGFRKTQDLLAFLGTIDQIPKVVERLQPVVDGVKEQTRVKISEIDRARFTREVEDFLEMYNRALYRMWGFVPFPKTEIQHMAAGLKWLIVPEWAVKAEVDGKLVGVVLALPDYNPVIKRNDGRLFPFGIFRMLASKKKLRMGRLISINVIPEYQMWGLGIVLLAYLGARSLTKFKSYVECEFSWVAESNSLAIQGLRKAGAKHYKTYRMYDYPPPAEGAAAQL